VRSHVKQRGRLLSTVGAGGTAAVLVMAIVGSGAAVASPRPELAGPASGPVKFSWGSFDLSSRIASKIRDHKTLTFDLSFQETAEPGAPDLLRVGLQDGAAWAKQKYGVTIKTNLIGTPQTDPPSQISQVASLTSAGQLDCVGVEPVTPGAFNNVINSTMAAGVPVMTVNTDSPASHRIAYYGVDDTDPSSPVWTGRIAGNFTVSWAHQNHVKLTSAALITGDTTASWAQGRMKGWMDVVKSAFPGIKITGTPTNAFTTGYTPATIQTDMQAFITGHPGVQFYFDSDWGAAEIAQLIQSQHLKGKVYTLGFNVDSTYIKDLQQGTLIGTVDQRYDLQAENFVKGCAQFLLGGVVPSTYQYLDPSIWTPGNVSQAVKLYDSIPGSLG
jgi:simple sugar transport system substrate-binding protein